MIGSDVIVQIMNINGKQISVGIKAPDDVDILREEVLIRQENESTGEGELR